MRSIKNKIAMTIATSMVLTGSVVLNSFKVQAATVKYNFTIDLLSGESFAGMFSFDDSTLTGRGQEDLLPIEEAGNVKVNLSIFGENLTEEDDVDFAEGLFPAVNFSNGNLIGLDILAPVEVGEPEFGGILVQNSNFSFITTEYFDLLGTGIVEVDGFQDFRGTVSYQLATTPEPASLIGLLTVSMIGAGSAMKKSSYFKSCH